MSEIGLLELRSMLSPMMADTNDHVTCGLPDLNGLVELRSMPSPMMADTSDHVAGVLPVDSDGDCVKDMTEVRADLCCFCFHDSGLLNLT